jgi:uncharacterized membrane protein (UPF0127 family)
MKRNRIFIIAFLGAIGIFYYVWQVTSIANFKKFETTRIAIGKVELNVFIADTFDKREQGLSGTKYLPPYSGMLFVFPQEGVYPFWMKNMNYSLDLLWINSNGEIVHVSEEVSPDTYPSQISSPFPIRSVLEVPAGFFKKENLKIGEKIFFYDKILFE